MVIGLAGILTLVLLWVYSFGCIANLTGVYIYQHYTTRNLSDIDHNVNNEADGPCKGIYAIIGTDFCCIRVLIIIGFSKVNASPDKPDIRTEGQNPV